MLGPPVLLSGIKNEFNVMPGKINLHTPRLRIFSKPSYTRFQGCSSWKWYFPYHYAPFASDFVNISSVANEFEKGTQPFQPMEQVCIFCSYHIYQSANNLMIDPECTIIDFYPFTV